MTREEAHKLVDSLFDAENSVTVEVEQPKKELPERKRVVRTKMSGDTVYFIDEDKKTRQRINGTQETPGPSIVESLGFTMSDVAEVSETELMGYQMAAPIYKIS